ncbi:hypothetical protein ACVII1_001360 [Bradyrhizobium elkanii]|uniref:Uncharacterized protein n=1 Tax=Bradyrhizobium elkanii TaxID=29448 RepID=A0ABV4F1A9_BRAEL|nr:hypothetical protein [Bradyrhizobium elkanii]MCS3881898.1 hypothetical protein [Bradyrhizobium elkanii]MCS4218658.1 hypothetical protein [Bradyrhizobium elkanii]MCW2110043.1 hypothetical protein [Bradyrhizobium elkanii]MCW2201585.1 hypothetical protein [Bradyrhizobium elkanii]
MIAKILNAKVDVATGCIILMLFAFAGIMMGGLHG